MKNLRAERLPRALFLAALFSAPLVALACDQPPRVADEVTALTTPPAAASAGLETQQQALGGPVDAPSNARAFVLGEAWVALSWTDNSSGEELFSVQRFTNGAGQVEVCRVAPNVTTCDDRTTVYGNTYTYYVFAYKGSTGWGPQSNQAVAQTLEPPAATNVDLVFTAQNRVRITWQDNSQGRASYGVYRGATGDPWDFVCETSVGSTSCEIDDFYAAGTDVWYVAAASNNIGETWSDQRLITFGKPPRPESPYTYSGSTWVELDWSDYANNETGFKVDRLRNGSVQSTFTVGRNATFYYDSGLTAGTTYQYRVRATNPYGDSPNSDTVTVTTDGPPPAPTGLTATATSTTTVDLTWTDAGTTTGGFEVYRAPHGTSTWELVCDYGYFLSCTDYGVVPATWYDYRVRAYNNFGTSGYSSTVNIKTPTPPATPSLFVATAVTGLKVNLSWKDNATTETGYTLNRWEGSNLTRTWTVGANSTSTVDTGLTPGVTYDYYVQAVSGVGGSDWVWAGAAFPELPWAPYALGGTVVSATQVSLGWVDDSDNEDLFRVERSTDGNTFTSVKTVGANVATAVDTTAAANTTYTYRVRAENISGSSSPSSLFTIRTAAPPAPSLVTPSIRSSAEALVTWQSNSTNESGFRLERAPSGSSSWATVCTAVAGQTYCIDSVSLTVGSVYQYRVAAFNGAGSSTSAVATLSFVGAGMPTAFSAALASATSVNLSWTNNGPVSGTVLYRSADGVSYDWVTTLDAPAATFTDTGLVTGTTYWYYVWAYNPLASSSSTTPISILVGPPVKPTNLNGSVFSATRVDLTWIDASSNETGFKVERAPSGSTTWKSVCTVGAGGQACSDTTSGLTSGSSYLYRVSATNVAGGTASDVITVAIAAPAAPTLLTGAVSAPTAVTLSWKDNSSNEQGFKVERSTDGGSTFTQIATPTAATYVDTGRTANSTYVYRVRSYNVVGSSAYTNTASIKVAAPAAPTTLAGVAGTSSLKVDLSWTNPSGSTATGVVVARSTDGTTFTDLVTVAATATSYSDLAVMAGATYSYRVRATNGAGASATSNTVTVPLLPPAAPTALVAVVKSTTQIDLTWALTGTNAANVRVERATDGVTFTAFPLLAGTATTYSNTGLTTGITYSYRVQALNAAGASAYSNTVSLSIVKPSAPSNLVAWAGSTTQANLSWTRTSNNESGFKVERSTDGTAFSQVGTVAAGVTTYADTGRTSGSSYWYRVRATNGAGDSAYSNVATLKIASPSAPTLLVVTLVSATRVDLGWKDNSNNEAGFEVERATDGTTFTKLTTTAVGAVSLTDTALTLGTTYTYRVRATNGVGKSGYSNTGSAKVAVPAAPSALSAKIASKTRVDLTWVNNATNQTQYSVERSSDGVTFVAVSPVLAVTALTYADTTVVANGMYFYRVVCSNVVGTSLPSASIKVVMQVPPGPTDLKGTVASTTEIDLAWSYTGANETGFAIERGTSATNIAQIATVGTGVKTYNNTGLTANTTYFYRVRAYNGVGNSIYTPIIALKTAKPDAPVLAVYVMTATSANLAWQDKASNETSYNVDRSTDNSTFTQIGTTGPGGTQLAATGLTSGGTYYFRVYAKNGAGSSAFSNVVKTTLAKPSGLTTLSATAMMGSQIKLDWTETATNETGIRIERSLDSSTWTEINVVSQDVKTFINTNLLPGTKYYYRLRTFNGLGTSSYSSIVNATTVDLIPLISCVRANAGTFTAVLGYKNPTPTVAFLTAGAAKNQLTGSTGGQVQPSSFQGLTASNATGTYPSMFVADFTTTLSWTLQNTTVTSTGAPPCAASGQGEYATFIQLPDGTKFSLPPDRGLVVGTSIVGTDLDTSGNAPGPLETDGLHATNDGAASYTIPLWVPDGKNELSPSLALRYHSRTGNGLVGVGWSLDGLSEIRRCPLTATATSSAPGGVPINAAIAPVTYEEPTEAFKPTYALCLDGRRLHEVATAAVPTTAYQMDDNPRTAITVTAFDANGPQTIQVSDGEGRIMTYGATVDSRLEAPKVDVYQNVPGATANQTWYTEPVRLGWALSSIQDRYGNMLSFKYDTTVRMPDRGAQQHLKEILYTRVGAAPGSCDDGASLQRCVRFTYENRQDPISQFVGGVKLVETQRLLKVEARGPAPSSTATLRSYKLTYNSGAKGSSITQRSLLTHVEECDLAGVCKKPVQFEWEPGSLTYETINVAAPSAGRTISSLLTVDLNKDGKNDLLVRDAGGWFFALSNGHGVDLPWVAIDLPRGLRSGQPVEASVADIDMDGRPEIGVWDDGQQAFIYYGTTAANPTHYAAVTSKMAPYMGDLDGDGLPDSLVFDARPSQNRWAYSLNTPSAPGTFGAPIDSGIVSADGLGRTTLTRLDGLNRIFLLSSWNLGDATRRMLAYYAPRSGGMDSAGRVSTSLFMPANGEFEHHYLFLDTNGDGLTDAFKYRNSQSLMSLHENTGSVHVDPLPPNLRTMGFLDQALATAPATFGTWSFWQGGFSTSDSGFRAADIDRDGKEDVVNTYRATWMSFAGGPTAPVAKALLPMPPTPPFLTSDLRYLSQMSDVNADGLPDLVQVLDTSPNLGIVVRQRESKEPDMITAVVDSRTSRSEADYKSIADSTVYSQAADKDGPTCRYPYFCHRSGVWVVSEVRRDNGLPGPGFNRETHTYAGARALMDTRGWLGMESHTIVDQTTHAERVLTFDNRTLFSFPSSTSPAYVASRAGFPTSDRVTIRTTSKAGPRRITYETTDNRIFFNHAAPMLVATIGLCKRAYENAGWDTEPTMADRTSEQCWGLGYDDYGNIVGSTLTMLDGETVLTNTDYAQSFSPRVLSIPKRHTSTSTVPQRGGLPARPPLVRTTTYTPDAKGSVATELVEPDLTGKEKTLQRTTTITRNAFGQVTDVSVVAEVTAPPFSNVTPPPGAYLPIMQERKIHYDFNDADGVYPSGMTNAVGHKQGLIYHPGLGVLAGSIDANGTLVAWRYDGFGRPKGENQPHEGDLAIGYQSIGSTFTTNMVRQGGNAVSASYDRLGRLVQRYTSGSRGRLVTQTFEYNDLGLIAKASTPTFELTPTSFTSFEYDQLGRTKKVIAPDGTTEWDYNGLRTETTDPRHNVSYTIADGLGRVVESGKGDQVTRFHFGSFSTLDQIVPPGGGGGRVAISYDRWGRRTAIDDPDAHIRQLSLNGFGDEVHRVDTQSVNEVRTYDPLGRTTTIVGTDGTTTLTYDLAPNGKGSVAETLSATGIRTHHQYDALGRLSVETVDVPGVAEGMALERSYDSFGRVAGMAYPVAGGKRLNLAYNYSAHSGAHLLNVTDTATGKYLWQVEDRSPFGDVAQEIFGNNFRVARAFAPETGLLRSLSGGFVPPASAAFNPEDRAQSVPGFDVAQIFEQQLAFDYDPNRNLKSRTDSRLSVADTFDYDGLDRLQFWTVNTPQGTSKFQYVYDGIGNLTDRLVVSGAGSSQKFEYANVGGANHAISGLLVDGVRVGNYAYGNGRGDQTSAPGRTVTYTQFDLPRTVTKGADTTTFSYDAFERRSRSTGKNGDIAYLGRFYELRKEPAGVAHVFHVLGESREVAQILWQENAGVIASEEARFIHADHLGSPETVTRGNGDVISHLRFEPFGASVLPQNPAGGPAALPGGLRTGFTGHEQDDDLGLVNMQGRIYDPASAHFLTPDPIVSQPLLGQSYNRYGYVMQNPMTFRDPTGFQQVDINTGSGTSGGSSGGGAGGSSSNNGTSKQLCLVIFCIGGNQAFEWSWGLGIRDDDPPNSQNETGQVHPAGADDNGSSAANGRAAGSRPRSTSGRKPSTSSYMGPGRGNTLPTPDGGDLVFNAGQKLPIRITGGTSSERTRVQIAIENVFSTKRGAQLLDMVAQKRAVMRAFHVNLWNAPSHSDNVSDDENATFFKVHLNRDGDRYSSRIGRDHSSWERMFAHEFGHIAGGNDDGPDRMNNVNENENAITNELREENPRTSYAGPDILSGVK
jgi:RHS repeat-associated protein